MNESVLPSSPPPVASTSSSSVFAIAEDTVHVLYTCGMREHDSLCCEETTMLHTVTLPSWQQQEQLDVHPDDLLSWSPLTPTTPTLVAAAQQQHDVATPALLVCDLFTMGEGYSELQRSPGAPLHAASMTDVVTHVPRLTSSVWSDQSAPTLLDAAVAHNDPVLAITGARTRMSTLDGQSGRRSVTSPCVPQMWETMMVWVNIVDYCDLRTVCELLRTCRRVRQQSTRDSVWRPVLERLNVAVLVPTHSAPYNGGANDSCGASDVERGDLYSFFLQEIITTRAIHGHYTCKSASRKGSQLGSGSQVDCVTLLISPAAFGHLSHSVGRVQLLLKYCNDTMEVLQGACRFSIHQHCFIFCCNLFSAPSRGPEFKVSASLKASARVTSHAAAASTGKGRSSAHLPTLRLTLVPMLQQSSGSQIRQTDIITVNRIVHKSTKRTKVNVKDVTA